jgi:hypothetical protein
MPDNAMERAVEVARQMIAHLDECNRVGRFSAIEEAHIRQIADALLAFAAQQAKAGWAKAMAFEEAASECASVGVKTIFASDLSDDFRAGYQAAVNTCCASLSLMGRHAVPDDPAMLDAAPSVTITGDQA